MSGRVPAVPGRPHLGLDRYDFSFLHEKGADALFALAHSRPLRRLTEWRGISGPHAGHPGGIVVPTQLGGP